MNAFFAGADVAFVYEYGLNKPHSLSCIADHSAFDKVVKCSVRRSPSMLQGTFKMRGSGCSALWLVSDYSKQGLWEMLGLDGKLPLA